MPSSLVIDRRITFRGDALYRANIRDLFQEEKRHDSDRFTGIALDTTNRWAVSVPGTSDTIAISEVVGGSALITTGTADNDSCMLAGAIIHNGTKLSVVEFRITITDVTGCGVFVGLSDAKSEANGQIALQYPSDTFTSTATSAAGFVIDADHSTSSIMCASVNAGSDTIPVDTGVDWVDGETRNLRILVDTSGNAIFVIDGKVVAQIQSAVAAGTLHCPTVQAITRANDGSNTIRVHSFDSWQDD